MFDLARGPLLVGVADRPAALVREAGLAPAARVVDLVEARVDLFPGQSLDAAAAAVADLEGTGTPVLVTVRLSSQGGRFDGPEPERLARFRAALAVASWADVEAGSAIEDDVAGLTAARPSGQLVVSHHDFERTPPLATLLALADRGHRHPGAVAKLATAARTDADRDALFALLEARPERTCVIGMAASDDLRIELAARGSLLAYGYLDAPTAPGQRSAAETHARLQAASPRYAQRRAG